MMDYQIAELLSQLTPDPWRSTEGFSDDIVAANEILLSETATDEAIIETLSDWLKKEQPCIFGRIAAAVGHLEFCILRETDLGASDEAIRERIQEARLRWVRRCFRADASGFIIVVLSRQIANATPNDVMKRLALRLGSLYLNKSVAADSVELDEAFLQKPDRDPITWRWKAGVNYFSTQGDKRWWHDHRIPGGMAFSVNSVGHMVKSAIVAKHMKELNKDLGISGEWTLSKVDTLDKALVRAMGTIEGAASAVSGPATELLPLPTEEAAPLPACPVELPAGLQDKNYCEYLGRYHTDFTVPSEYFRPEVERPAELVPFMLDFTYLFYRSLDNPDYFTMGEGEQIRTDDGSVAGHRIGATVRKTISTEEEVRVEDCELLKQALQ